MKFGFSAPNRGPLGNAQAIKTIAQRAEVLGYDVLSVSDHLVVPQEIS
ncbi:MAG: LLM class F420-dependent oxidoreductase, partial [Chromatiales bacterium]|nr:LLM class F420-dependent oxidoreductase [Chromatiales bacterium]